ncbi:MAG: PEP-CTERM sorting domain-containing protein [Verrucomicrobiaceae bacterium]
MTVSASFGLSANAQTYGVTGSSGQGTLQNNSIYKIENGIATRISPTAVTPNSFAYDTDNDRYYYGDHSGTNLYLFDPLVGSNTLIGDLTDYGMPTGTALSGGGDFFDSAYYYISEPTGDTATLNALTFGNDGTTIATREALSLSLPSGWSGIGDFGDFAVDSATGLLYGSSTPNFTAGGNTTPYLWQVDLNATVKTVTNLGATPSVYQIAIDATTGKLHANEWQSGGAFYELDKSDGSILTTQSVGGDFFDLASGGANAAPEPSSAMLAALGALGLMVRRKR